MLTFKLKNLQKGKPVFKTILTVSVAIFIGSFIYAQASQTVERQQRRVVIHQRDNTGRISYDIDNIAHLSYESVSDESGTQTAGLPGRDITDKSKWSVLYGSIAMQFGAFDKMIDGREDNDGWMGFIDNGFNNSPGLGHPFAVVDLGEQIRLSALGIQAGNVQNSGAYDVMPARVDFYITDRQDISISLTERERALMNGSDYDNYDNYLAVHRKLREADAYFGWRKVGSVIIGAPDSRHVGRYFYHLDSNQLKEGLSSRYVKLDVTPFNTDRTGDRTKIFEFYVRAIDESADTGTRGKDVTKVTVTDRNGQSQTLFDGSKIDRIELDCNSRSYDMERITDKSAWRVLYGSIAMPYFGGYETPRNEAYSAVIDNITDGAGWMSHICDTYSRSQNLGDPYIVIDLGTEYPMARVGVHVDNLNSDVTPKSVEIYYTPVNPTFSFNPDPVFTESNHYIYRHTGDRIEKQYKYTDAELAAGLNIYTERQLLNGRNIRGLDEEGHLSDAYLDLARRLREHDAAILWHKLADINVCEGSAEESDTYMANVYENNPEDIDVPMARYIKVVVKPYGKTEHGDKVIDPEERPDDAGFNYHYQGDRTKINEIIIDRMTEVNGIGIDTRPVAADMMDEIDGSIYDFRAHTDANGKFLPEQPYRHNYNRLMMLKFYMAEPNRADGTSTVFMNYEEALENIRKIDNLTQGIEKVIYLVGWNALGHDDGYPSLHIFNEALKRPGDTSARQSLQWLQQEAKKYHATVSVHFPLHDAYHNSPDWNTYVYNDLLCREKDGSLNPVGTLMGQDLYHVNLVREWEEGYLQQRIRRITELCGLSDAGTVHLDAFFPTESPWHGTTKLDSERVMRQVIRYWRTLGVDVTAEFFINNGNRSDAMYGLQAAAWWNDVPFEWRVEPGFTPALACGGMSGYCGTYFADAGFLLGDSMHGEDVFKITDETERWTRFKHDFCTTTLPSMLLTDLYVESYGLHQDGISWVNYNKGVRAEFDDTTGTGRITCDDGNVVFRDGNDLMFHITWGTGDPVLYSEKGYTNRTWRLASHWADAQEVKLMEVTPEGLVYRSTLPVTDGTITLSLAPGEMFILNR